MADQLNVLVICGSLRKKSFNAALTRALPELAPANMKFIPAPDFEILPPYNADIQDASGFPPAAEDLAQAIRHADGVLIVSPEYNWSIPGTLKNAIDWVSRMKDQPFKQKPVALQSCSQGVLGGARMQYAMRMTLIYLNAFTFGTPEVLVAQAQNKFDKDLKLTDESTRGIVRQQLEGFAKFIARVKG
ncbi:MAG TPA: NADPH-dependent FMN reductase [Pseudolabrys sp.]|nr:NADPH-dependent FMN reductase [Pseudolabrys sp.]